MTYKTGQYAHALADALADAEPETARTRIRTFLKILKKHQMLGKAEHIARLTERLLTTRAGIHRVVLESASAVSSELRKDISNVLDGKVWLEEKIRPQLLAGVRILIDDETLIDASGDGRLVQMFQRKSRA